MLHRALSCAVVLLGCTSGGDHALFVDVKTDLVPGEEFTGARIRLMRDGATLATQDTVAVRSDDYVAGDRAFEEEGLSTGPHRVVLELIDGDGNIVAERAAQVQVQGNVGITLLVPRDIRSCDPTSCAAGTTCGGTECVDETCTPETPETCPPAGCVENGDCDARASCSIPVCVSGTCFYASMEGGCAPAEWCNPDEGCLPSSPMDGGMPDGGVDGGLCEPGLADCDGDMVCEMDVSEDVRNCGDCGVRCGAGDNGTPACRAGVCGFDCEAGFEDCDGMPDNGCETTPADDPSNCGVCGSECPASLPICLGGDCIANPFPSDGSEGAFEPSDDTVLASGVHQFTTITIPAGVRVTTDGSGVLELRATGDVVIEGIIDVSGGDGIDAVEAIGVGGGGETGTTVVGVRGAGAGCPPAAGGGVAGIGGDGGGACGAGGRSGGGSGGGSTAIGAGAGGGGGGPAGGAGGNRASLIGGAGGSIAGMSFGGGQNGEGGEPARAGSPYRGGNGGTAVLSLGGGGGGSIGGAAIDDLAMASTFFPGSGGGGGSGVTDGSGAFMGCGGGGGGGAVRIASNTSIRLALSGSILARGGRGGGSGASRLGAGGGGGSGGAVFVAAPAVTLVGDVDAGGGLGGNGFSSADGGAGGLGRIRISAQSARCEISGTTTPPMMGACVPTDGEGFVYVDEYPL